MTVVLVAEYDADWEFIGDGRDSSTSYTYSTSTSTGTGSTTATTVEVPPQTVVEGSTEGMVEDRTEDTVPADKDESSASTVPCTIYPVQPYHSTTSTTITGMAAMGDVPTTETFYSSTEAETYHLQVQVGITRQDTDMADSVDPVLTDLASRLDTRISPNLVVAIVGGSCDASEITFATTTSEAAVAVVAMEDGVVVTTGNHNNRPTTRPTQTFSPTQTYSPTHTYSPTITPYPTTATYRPTAVMLDPVVVTSETTKNTAIRRRKQRRHLQEGSSTENNNKATLAVMSVWTCGTFSFFFFLF